MADFEAGADNSQINQGHEDASAAEIASVFDLPSDAPAAEVVTPPTAAEPAAGSVAPAPAAAPLPGVGEHVAPAPAPADGLTPQPGAPQPAPAPAASPPAVPTPAAAPAAQPVPDEVATLRTQLAALQARLDNPTPAGGAPASPAAGNESPAVEPPVDYSTLAIPPQLSDAIFNEDGAVARQGMQHLVQTLASVIHTRVRDQFRTEMRTELQQRDQAAGQERTQQQQADDMARMQGEYYADFPTHNTPLVKTIVAHEATQLAAQQPTLAWGPEYRNALGARVNAAIQALTGAAPAPQPAPNPAPPAPAPFVPMGTRADAAKHGEPTNEDVIEDLFGA